MLARSVATVVACSLFLTANAQSAAFDHVVEAYAKNKQFSGAVLVAKGGNILYKKAFGSADRSIGIVNTPETKFRIASITKTFTVVMLLQLVEEGKLSLQGTIGTYLPWYKGEGKDKVTLHHLITYSSGIPNCEGGKGLQVYQDVLPIDTFITRYCSGKLNYQPGSQFQYDNGAYIILGRIIEAVTRMSFADNLKKRILEPLGMSRTGFVQEEAALSDVAVPYFYDNATRQFQSDPFYRLSAYYSSGAITSTVEDLLMFDQAIFNAKLFTPKTLDLMLVSYADLWQVAYGFWVTENQYGSVWDAAADIRGSIMASNSSWVHLLREKVSVIVLSNTNAADVTEMRDKLVLSVLGQLKEPQVGAVAAGQ